MLDNDEFIDSAEAVANQVNSEKDIIDDNEDVKIHEVRHVMKKMGLRYRKVN